MNEEQRVAQLDEELDVVLKTKLAQIQADVEESLMIPQANWKGRIMAYSAIAQDIRTIDLRHRGAGGFTFKIGELKQWEEVRGRQYVSKVSHPSLRGGVEFSTRLDRPPAVIKRILELNLLYFACLSDASGASSKGRNKGALQAMSKYCPLCGLGKGVIWSHVIPRSTILLFEQHEAVGENGERVAGPIGGHNAGEMGYYCLCATCDGRFGRKEDKTVTSISLQHASWNRVLVDPQEHCCVDVYVAICSMALRCLASHDFLTTFVSKVGTLHRVQGPFLRLYSSLARICTEGPPRGPIYGPSVRVFIVGRSSPPWVCYTSLYEAGVIVCFGSLMAVVSLSGMPQTTPYRACLCPTTDELWSLNETAEIPLVFRHFNEYTERDYRTAFASLYPRQRAEQYRVSRFGPVGETQTVFVFLYKDFVEQRVLHSRFADVTASDVYTHVLSHDMTPLPIRLTLFHHKKRNASAVIVDHRFVSLSPTRTPERSPLRKRFTFDEVVERQNGRVRKTKKWIPVVKAQGDREAVRYIRSFDVDANGVLDGTKTSNDLFKMFDLPVDLLQSIENHVKICIARIP